MVTYLLNLQMKTRAQLINDFRDSFHLWLGSGKGTLVENLRNTPILSFLVLDDFSLLRGENSRILNLGI